MDHEPIVLNLWDCDNPDQSQSEAYKILTILAIEAIGPYSQKSFAGRQANTLLLYQRLLIWMIMTNHALPTNDQYDQFTCELVFMNHVVLVVGAPIISQF